MAPNIDRSITTQPVRLAFNQLFKKRGFGKKAGADSEDAKFSAVLLFPPDYDLAPIKAMLKAAVVEQWGTGPVSLSDRGMPLHKCKGNYDGFLPGWHYMRAQSGYAPQVIDQQLQPIIDLDQQTIFAGCWIRANIKPYTWDNEFGKGVSVNLNAVQLVRQDVRLDGRKNAAEIFDAIDISATEEAPAAAPASKPTTRVAKPSTGQSVDELFG